MSIPTHPPSTLAGLKSQAKKLKRQQGITHTEALEQIARWMGYDSYRQANAALSNGAYAPLNGGAA